ncbi:quinolinate synthase NadA [bacterium]|nr:quinolinate synthase NadA [bacterium]
MEKIQEEILELKKQLGSELLILGHHYQRHGIVELADKIGDSFGLAKAAAEATGVKSIVFCGVRFMAESAAILCRDDQKVYHPEPEAGCPMADMAPMEAVEEAWSILTSRPDYKARKMIPVTYMNSHAPLKGFTGKHGGAVCTSSNAKKVMDWAFTQGDLILFFPDQHLGRNTAKLMGIKEEEMRVWYPSKPDGGIDSLEGVKLLLWNGHCPVHMKFTVRDVEFVKKNFPGCLVAVHPECPKEVVDLADAVGSTTHLVDWIKDLPHKTRVFVATEVNLVRRMQQDNPHLRVEMLSRSLCPTMYMVDLFKLKRSLEKIIDKTEEAVPMPDEIKGDALKALERMLALA